MRLSEWIAKSGAEVESLTQDAVVNGIESDSRKTKPGDLFVCMPSNRTDTLALIPQAIEAGATSALVFKSPSNTLHLPTGFAVAEAPLRNHAFADATWKLTHEILGHPSRQMKVVGVTGTNGKTTTAWLMQMLMAAVIGKSSYLGTLGYLGNHGLVEVGNTTPFAVDLGHFLKSSQEDGFAGFAMEVSSHALAEHRADGVEFDSAVFTNLTQDHLDFHETLEAYGQAKERLFLELPAYSQKQFRAAVNIDDPFGKALAAKLEDPITFSKVEGSGARLQGEVHEVLAHSIQMTFHFEGHRVQSTFPLGAQFNVQNALAAVAGLVAAGLEFQPVVGALKRVQPVPGRFESVPTGSGYSVIVDYAHTPDALEKLLDSARELNPKKVITVFGCGGDRDRTKRPIMARISSLRSDLTVLTSDNPRTEDPDEILNEVESGVAQNRQYMKIMDRKEAIFKAIELAEEGTIVVIAGKGHEDYQIIGHTKHKMDDRLMAREAISLRRSSK